MKIRKPFVIAAAAAVVGAAGVGTAAVLAGAASPPTASRFSPENSHQWVMPAGNYASTRFSALTQINSRNARNLQVSWEMSLGTERGLEGQPLVIGDNMYMVSSYPNYVYAVNLATQQFEWKYVLPAQAAQPLVPPGSGLGVSAPGSAKNSAAANTACCDVVNRGLVYDDGKLFYENLDGVVVALQASTGKPIWKVHNTDPKIAQTSTSAPIVIHHKVIVGMSGNEYGVLGYLTAYNESTGHRLWRVYNVGTDRMLDPSARFLQRYGPNSSLKTWPLGHAEWKTGGGAPWAWYSYDPKLNLLYYGSGNPGVWNPSQRPGDNKWAESVMARDPDNGKLVWAYQFTPHDQWDYDSTQEMILANVNYRGHRVPALVHFDKNGYAYVLNRATGQLLAAHPYDPNGNSIERVNMATGRPVYNPLKETMAGRNSTDICPFAQGAKDEQPASYDPQTGLFYVPTNNGCMDYQPYHVTYHPGDPYVGAIVRFYQGPGGYGGAMEAFNPMTGKIRFMDKENWPVWSGVLTTAGHIAVYGTMDGWFKVVNVDTGRLLYRFHMPSGVFGNPIAYTTPSGQENIAVFAGVGGWPAEYIGNGDPNTVAAGGAYNPTDDLGSVNYYAFGHIGSANGPTKKPLQDEVNLGGDLVVFHVPGAR
jgi:PQQ-dependent dehydrogenase (methanol/ethanol family)